MPIEKAALMSNKAHQAAFNRYTIKVRVTPAN
jgi:hypothetical protein